MVADRLTSLDGPKSQRRTASTASASCGFGLVAVIVAGRRGRRHDQFVGLVVPNLVSRLMGDR